MNNITHLRKHDRGKTWGKDSWKKLTIHIFGDCRRKINSRTLSIVGAPGAYQEGIVNYCRRWEAYVGAYL